MYDCGCVPKLLATNSLRRPTRKPRRSPSAHPRGPYSRSRALLDNLQAGLFGSKGAAADPDLVRGGLHGGLYLDVVEVEFIETEWEFDMLRFAGSKRDAGEPL